MPWRRRALLPLGISASLAAPWPASAQRSLAFDPGPHAVGFTLVEALDSTRAFRPLRDFRGRIAAETARPVQISVWYPAQPVAGARGTAAGEFRLLTHRELDFDIALTASDTARLRAEFVQTAIAAGTDSTAAARLWDEPTPAVRGATPLPGPHPTVLYFGALGANDPLLPAYLASHGFVVAAFPSNGRMTDGALEYTPNALTLETSLNDGGFVHAVLRRLPYADAGRAAVASFSGSSLGALLWVMRDMQASAFVSIEGWERYRRGADILAGSIHYEPHRVRIPMLLIERAPNEASPQFAKVPDVVDALNYAHITRVAFRDASHGDFLSHAPFGQTSRQPDIYQTSARTVRTFLESALMNDAGAARALARLVPPPSDSLFTVLRMPGIGPVPTEEELYHLAETDPAEAASAYRDAIRTVRGSELFRESVLTRAAILAPTPTARAAILEIVADAYPASTAARFRLGQALVEAGRATEAMAVLRRALEIVEDDPSLDDEARTEWRARIRAALEEHREPDASPSGAPR